MTHPFDSEAIEAAKKAASKCKWQSDAIEAALTATWENMDKRGAILILPEGKSFTTHSGSYAIIRLPKELNA